ncbi:MAG TPA: hypothetical protein VGK49_01825 [Ilumatobacteraceae bacterium]
MPAAATISVIATIVRNTPAPTTVRPGMSPASSSPETNTITLPSTSHRRHRSIDEPTMFSSTIT